MITNATIIGSVYLAIGIFGMVENSFTTLLMATDPEMRHSTYIYMINLGLTDTLILLPIATYAGIAILFPSNIIHPAIIRTAAYLIAIGWYPGCMFMVLASYSRYVQLATPNKADNYFCPSHLIGSIVFAWSVPAVVYTHFLYYSPIPFDLYLDHFTWAFNRDDKFGNAWSIVNISVNSSFAVLIIYFNIKSLITIRKIRHQIHSFETEKQQKREILLFLQCSITGTIYCTAVVYYFVVSAIENILPWYAFVITHALWIANHLQNPFIYFLLNKRLRIRVGKLFRGKWKPPQSPHTHTHTPALPGSQSIFPRSSRHHPILI